MSMYVGYLPRRCGIGEIAAIVGSSGDGMGIGWGWNVGRWVSGIGVGSSGENGLCISGDGGLLGSSGGGVPVVGAGRLPLCSMVDMSDGRGALAAHTSLCGLWSLLG